MKILFLVPDPALGPEVPFGDSIRVRLLVEALQALGHDVRVNWAGGGSGPGGAAGRRHRLPQSVAQPLRDARALARAVSFRRGLDPGSPDLVFEFGAPFAPVGGHLARSLGVPHVVEIEGPIAELRYAEGGSLLRRLGSALERADLRRAAGVVTVSQPLADYLEARGAPPERTFVVPNAVDASRFAPSPERRSRTRDRLGAGDAAVVVGFHGVFSPWYRLDRLVRAVAEADDPRLQLLLIGDGVERPRVEAEIEATGLGARATITGFVAHDEVAELVDALDIGVVPDHAWWTSPLKLFEYGAMRVPVIAADAPSIISVARDGEVQLVRQDDQAALAAAIRELAGDPALRGALAERWAGRVGREFTDARLADRLAEVLERATG